MKYLLIRHSGEIKEYRRMPSLIDPRDLLIEVGSHSVVNHVISISQDKLDQDRSNIPEREAAVRIAAKLGIIKAVS